jgi:hypothetical protein
VAFEVGRFWRARADLPVMISCLPISYAIARRESTLPHVLHSKRQNGRQMTRPRPYLYSSRQKTSVRRSVCSSTTEANPFSMWAEVGRHAQLVGQRSNGFVPRCRAWHQNRDVGQGCDCCKLRVGGFSAATRPMTSDRKTQKLASWRDVVQPTTSPAVVLLFKQEFGRPAMPWKTSHACSMWK